MVADATGASRVLAAAQAVALLRRRLLSVVLVVGEGPEEAYRLPCRSFRLFLSPRVAAAAFRPLGAAGCLSAAPRPHRSLFRPSVCPPMPSMPRASAPGVLAASLASRLVRRSPTAPVLAGAHVRRRLDLSESMAASFVAPPLLYRPV